MNRPLPLTACPAPSLDWSRPGVPAAKDFGDIYFSTDGGLQESQAVFLQGCDLPKRWQNKPHCTIGELGFGSGLNFLSTWQMWEEAQTGGYLHFVSVEKYPFSQDELQKALSHWPLLGSKAQKLTALWPGRVKGFHRLHLAKDVTLTLIHDDIITALSALEAKIDSWFLDGFSPSKNPEMWSQEVMDHIARLSHTDTRLSSFSVAGHVRKALSSAGFTVEKKTGFGRKRHRLEAIYKGEIVQTVQPAISPIIIGAGIAGASLAHAFRRYGITPIMFEKDMAYKRAASGNPAALIKPRLDLQDRPESRFFLSSFLYACHLYAQSGAITARSNLHKSKTAKDTDRFVKLALQAALPSKHLALKGGDLDLRTSLVINPEASRNYLLGGIDIRKADIARFEKKAGIWRVFDGHNKQLAQGSHLIICAGADIKTLPIDGLERFRFSRGQLSWAKADKRLDGPVTYGGYALPIDADILLGATHNRLDDADPYTLDTDSDAENFEAFEQAIGYGLTPLDRASRASVRVTTANTLPRAGIDQNGTWIFSGLGSRGFVFAPLLGDFIACKILGLPSPLESTLSDIFAPKTAS